MSNRDVTGVPAIRQIRGSEEIARTLGALSFPCSKQELIASLGDHKLEYDRETAAPLAELVRGLPHDKFVDVGQARRAVDGQWTRIVRNLAAIERGQVEQRARELTRAKK